jgi:hypothetical protein
MRKPRLRLVTPNTENRTVTPRRPKNGDIRTREHLTIDEVERLIEVVKDNRYGHRDALMVLLAFRHGLRAGEVVDLRLGPDRLQNSHPTRPPAQERHPQHASPYRPGTEGAAPSSARQRQIAPSYSSRSAARLYPRQVSLAWSSEQQFPRD